MFLDKTRNAYMWTRVLNTPFWAIYTLLPFIIYKDLHASAWQVACLISLKPIVSVFSLYWSSLVKRRSDRLISNVVWAGILSHLPFFFAPFITNAWYFVLASGVYMLFYRGVNPAWMEILKINVPEGARKSFFAYVSAFYHIGGAVFSIGIGWLLSEYYEAWRWLFPLFALLSLLAIAFQLLIPIKESVERKEYDKAVDSFSFKDQFKKPWKEAWDLLKERPDFTRFQIGFMLGGGGLMLWQPALPAFFFDTLQLSYKELAVAMTFCKGIGYTFAVPFWTRLMNKMDIFVFSGIVTLIAALFPVGLMLAQWHIFFLFGAYLLYGMMQAGSELSWNLSGPIFAKHEDSSTYSGVNVVSIGLRGCIAPPFGSLLCTFAGATPVLILGGGLCLLATWHMHMNKKREERSYLLSKLQTD
ncbi:MAG: MFS transporter [Parachlamydiaceae bacterium]|nr:MFS transporter [Parachlamydiaceae bacterium]